MDSINIPLKALIGGSTNPGKTQHLVDQLQGRFRGKFDYTVLSAQPFSTTKPTTGLWITIRESFVIYWGKRRSKSGDKHAHCFGRLHCLKGSERQHRSSGFSRLFRPTCRHQRFGSDTADHRHLSNFREHVATIVLFYTPSAKTMKAIFEKYTNVLSPKSTRN